MAEVTPRADAAQAPSSSVRRSWTLPTIRALPKLTALTLASAIGGGGGTGGGGSTVFGFLLAVGLALGAGACAVDPERSTPSTLPVAPLQILSCHADRRAGSLTCDAPAAAPGQGILGNQGVNIGLRSTNVSYDGVDVLSADVTVENFTTGPIGTLDGTTLSSGVNVFFVAGPDATPTGIVTVVNPTGTNGAFTGSNQTYFNYPQVLGAFQISDPVTWEFQFAGGADAFTFSVLVAADLSSPGAIQSWSVEPGFAQPTWRGVAGWGTDGIFVAGDLGINYVREGGVWRGINDPSANFQPNPGRISTGEDGKVVMVGSAGGGPIARYWDRSGWQTLSPPTGTTWGATIAYGSVFIAGSSLYRRTSSGWEDEGLPGSTSGLRGAWTIGGLLVVEANDGTLWTWDEGYTQLGGSGPGQNTTSNLILFGPDTSTLWSVSDASLDPTVRFYDGTGWSNQTLPYRPSDGVYPQSGTGTSDTSAFITAQGLGQGWVFHWNGSAWMTDTSALNTFPGGIWARSDSEAVLNWSDGPVQQRDGMGVRTTVLSASEGRATWMLSGGIWFMVDQNGYLHRYDGTTWTSLGDAANNVGKLWASGPNDAWVAKYDYFIAHYDGVSISDQWMDGTAGIGVGGSGPSDVWAVGYSGQVAHYDGAAWTTVVGSGALVSGTLQAVWAASPTFAVAVGDGSAILMWNGTSWSTATSPVGVDLRSVHGTSSTDVWAVGSGGVILHWDGDDWSQVTSGSSAQLNGVSAAGANEAYVVVEDGNILRYNGTAWQYQSVAGIGGSYPLYSVSVWNGRGLIAGRRSFRGRD